MFGVDREEAELIGNKLTNIQTLNLMYRYQYIYQTSVHGTKLASDVQ